MYVSINDFYYKNRPIIGDIIYILPNYHLKSVYSSIDLLLLSSDCGDMFVKKHDIGIIFEIPTIWGKTGKIFGVLFGNKKKYVPRHFFETIKIPKQ